MAAPKLDVAAESGVEDLAWFRTSALTVSLWPGGLICCQSKIQKSSNHVWKEELATRDYRNYFHT
jgi:hypothetical protein